LLSLGCGASSDSPTSPTGAYFEGAFQLSLALPSSGTGCLSQPGSVAVTASESNRIVMLSASGASDFLRLDYEPTGSNRGQVTNVFLHLFTGSIDLGGQSLTGSYHNEGNAEITLRNGRGEVPSGLLTGLVPYGCQLVWSLTPR
jgi:hypothetical protein